MRLIFDEIMKVGGSQAGVITVAMLIEQHGHGVQVREVWNATGLAHLLGVRRTR
jgi:hypothetical protein